MRKSPFPVNAQVDAEDARERARRILQEDRFQPEKETGNWLTDLRDWLGDRLEGPFRALGDVLRPIWEFAQTIPGSLLLGGVVISLVFLVAMKAIKNRAPSKRQAPAGSVLEYDTHTDPSDLERQADQAEAAGDMALAVRLRFRAGLIRIRDADVVDIRSFQTTSQLRRAIPARSFSPVADQFEEIIYGGRTATADDATMARECWRQVLREVAS